MVSGKANAIGNGGVRAGPSFVQDFDRHQGGAVGDARDADAIVCALGNGTSHVRTVAVVIVGMGVVVDEVIASDEFCLVQVRSQHEISIIFIGNAGVDDRYGYTCASCFCPG